jgi:hypothetical protein
VSVENENCKTTRDWSLFVITGIKKVLYQYAVTLQNAELWTSETRVIRRTSGPTRNEETREWRKFIKRSFLLVSRVMEETRLFLQNVGIYVQVYTPLQTGLPHRHENLRHHIIKRLLSF